MPQLAFQGIRGFIGEAVFVCDFTRIQACCYLLFQNMNADMYVNAITELALLHLCHRSKHARWQIATA